LDFGPGRTKSRYRNRVLPGKIVILEGGSFG
jgi:hypothetical protein